MVLNTSIYNQRYIYNIILKFKITKLWHDTYITTTRHGSKEGIKGSMPPPRSHKYISLFFRRKWETYNSITDHIVGLTMGFYLSFQINYIYCYLFKNILVLHYLNYGVIFYFIYQTCIRKIFQWVLNEWIYIYTYIIYMIYPSISLPWIITCTLQLTKFCIRYHYTADK